MCKNDSPVIYSRCQQLVDELLHRTAQNGNLSRSIFYAHIIEYRRFRETGVMKSDEGKLACRPMD